ncbi:hypothetical protein CHKEEEPN_3289 [Methylorubrum podarium]|nr:hypothetical protein CHKEEEPN_3289 [Methylorubrum podarium]
MSRPRTFAVTTTRRRPFSRETWFGPSATEKLATCFRRTDAARPFGPGGSGTGMFSNASRFSRTLSLRRTTMGKRRSPSNTSPASLPPMAAPMTSWTAPVLSPSRAASALLILISRKGRPAVCSTLTSSAPSMPRRISAIWSAAFVIGPNSSPNTFTARSPRAPASSSLKRSWIGWENSNTFPARAPTAFSIFSWSSALDRSGSGHSSWGFRITKVSEEFCGIGSDATSAVPVFEKT